MWSPYPARTRPGRGRWLPFGLAVSVVLTTWWLVTASGLIAPLYLPNPGAVVTTMAQQVASGVLWHYLGSTLAAAVIGALIASAIAVPLGFCMSHSAPLAAVLEPFVAISQTVPLVAVAPLLVLWIGYGVVPIAVLCAVIAFFPMATTTVVGLRHLDMRVVENAVLDGASRWQLLRHIETPMAAPAILAGVRSGVVLSITGAVVGEFVIGGSGLGTLLTLARQSANTAAVFAAIAWMSLAAMFLHFVVQLAERAAVTRLQGEHT